MPTKTITIPAIIAANIVDMANDLRGETALEDYGIMISDPSDEQLRGISHESLLRFYVNAKTLTRYINREIDSLLKGKE